MPTVKLRHIPLVIATTLFVTLVLSTAAAQESTSEPDATATTSPTATSTATPTLTPFVQPTQTGLYEPLFFRVPVDPSAYTNPFDAQDVEVVGVFESPSGQEIAIPGFWMQPYEDDCQPPCEVEDLQPAGDPEWQVRFTPDEVGAWTYTLQVRDDGAVVSNQEGAFDVSPSEQRGFVRVGANERYFRYDDGTAYFPIGHNLNWSWAEGGGLYAYERWLDTLSAQGGNYARVIIDVPWFIGLEWDSVGDYRAAQDDAARLDAIIEIAEERGVALQLVLLWHQALRTYNGAPVLVPDDPPRPDMSADWDDNPYNAANGGPLSGPGFFFFDDGAQDLFRKRLRYIVARWGYSPQVFAWELIDEIDQTAVTDSDITGAWLQDMASYLRQIDPQQHLITAGSHDLNDALTENPLLDFTQTRLYQRLPIESTGEQEASVINGIRQNLDLNDVPTLMTSFSINPWFEPTASDPDAVAFQNTLWAAALSGAGGGAISAWGETYVVPEGLERYYAPLAAFTAGIDWPNLNLQPAEAGLLAEGSGSYQPVRLSDFNRRFRQPPGLPITRLISPDGVFPSLQTGSSFLYGQVYNRQYNQPQLYEVAPPVDTYLEIGVRAVSDQAGARLVVAVDNEVVVQVNLEIATRNASVRVPLPAGEHHISINNGGDDWLELDYIEVGQLIAPARVLTLRDSSAGVALAWIQHRGYTWDQVANGVEREPLLFRYRLAGMPPGRYTAEIWDPLSGAVLGEEVLRVRDDGVLSFELVPLTRQLAIRAFRQPDTPPPAPAFTRTPQPTATNVLPTTEATEETTHEALEVITPTPLPTRTSVPTAEASRRTPFPTRTSVPATAASTAPPLAVTNTPRATLRP